VARTIWKFPLLVTDSHIVKMPSGARILRAAMQGATLCVWALVDPDMPEEPRRVQIYGTGYRMPDDPGRYIDTFMVDDGRLVFHAFEQAP